MKTILPSWAKHHDKLSPSWPNDSSDAPSETTVLVVEDDAMVRAVVQESLQSYGYGVLVSQNGFEALTMLCEHPGPIELILADLILPGMTGPQLVERAITLRPGLKMLFMSGYPEHMTVQSRERRPSILYLQKPFAPMELLDKVRQVLAGPATCHPADPDRASGTSLWSSSDAF